MQQAENRSEAAAYRDDEKLLAAKLFNDYHADLSRIARKQRRNAGFGATMETIDVLHESYIKLAGKQDFRSLEHFRSTAVLAIRQVIVDHARYRVAEKRGGDQLNANIDDLNDTLADFGETPEQILEINQLLTQLESKHPRWMRIVDARYFAGLSHVEIAVLLGVSERTVRRDWNDARAWLADKMGVGGSRS